jgi:WD40 repeat protein
LAFSPDGQQLASGLDSTVAIWDVATGQQLHTLSGYQDTVGTVAFAPGGRELASGCRKMIKVWEVGSWKEVHTFSTSDGGNISGMALSSDGQKLALGTYYGAVELLNLASGNELHRLQGFNRADKVSVAFSPEGNVLAAGSKNTIKLWDVATGKELKTLTRGEPGRISGAAFSPDGRELATGNFYGAVDVWDMASWSRLRLLTSLNGPSDSVFSIAFSPSGDALAAGYARGDAVRLWKRVR